uniref:Uncharacterized protein n=1 Tax=Candidatus Caldatribacterium saccharofermentans TaxID=1454753 RepID=A0A7V4TXY5_9BACT
MLGLGNSKQIVYRDEEDTEVYKRLQEEEIFKDLDWKDIFIIAVGWGIRKNSRKPIQKRDSGGFFRTSYLREEDEVLLAAAAVYAESDEVLKDGERVLKIAEEYARGGVHELWDWVQSTPLETFEKDFEAEVVKLAREFLQADEANA